MGNVSMYLIFNMYIYLQKKKEKTNEDEYDHKGS